ncbi:hypothetical protein UO65_1814 [Actinokineospora spheciospongiae]|uniref:Uncharacterized protein n=1 Tax=Actinokineospora spheciospongiae TaxID=909613 RepID=W7J1P5_9PSEU|nr:hypothetical protein [Actinokineospora spheciospongiae]EWC62866.1 hypothetical protein UO65_1814 [Actinokineospora spheciospongiae]
MSATQREAPAVEPPTDVPALSDGVTGRALRALRLPLFALPATALVFGAPAAWLAAAGASWLVVAVLTIAALAFVIAFLLTAHLYGTWLRPAARLLAAQPWRRAAVTVFRPARGRTPLLVTEPDGTRHALVAAALPWAVRQVFARTGRVWLVGPDAGGWVALRSSGLALPLGAARVTAADVALGYEVEVAQPAPVRAPVAAADAVVSRLIAGPRRRSRTELIAPTVLLVFAGVVIADLLGRDFAGELLELTLLVLLATLLLAGLLAWRVRKVRYWAKVDRMLGVGGWTPVPATLAESAVDGGPRTVTAQAVVAGRTVPVTLPRASQALRANVAGTGKLWVAGVPAPGAEAVAGLPGYPYLNLARFGS